MIPPIFIVLVYKHLKFFVVLNSLNSSMLPPSNFTLSHNDTEVIVKTAMMTLMRKEDCISFAHFPL